MNILLIEDDEVTLAAISHSLVQDGHQVITATNGRQAVDKVLDNKIDLVICDLMLPVISGVSFLRIRNKFMSPKTPVIAISVLDNAEEILKNMGVEFGFFIKKPFRADTLRELVNSRVPHIDNKEPKQVFYV